MALLAPLPRSAAARLATALGRLAFDGFRVRRRVAVENVLARLQPSGGLVEEKVRYAIELTKNNDRLILNVAFNYGGRDEIVQAVKNMIREHVKPESVTEDLLSKYMYTGTSPDPDLIIRTSGEFRTSNFLIWQAAYAEYYITPVYWPDFDKDEYYKALHTFSQRDRRYGEVKT
jgi:undecaprenyl diphosphate synthase